MNGRIAVTPIQLDLTASRLLGRLRSWSWDLPQDAPAAGDVAERLDRP